MNELSRVVHAWLNRMRCELVIVQLCISCLSKSLFPVLLPTLPMSCITSTFCNVCRSCFVFSFLSSSLQCARSPISLRTCRYCFQSWFPKRRPTCPPYISDQSWIQCNSRTPVHVILQSGLLFVPFGHSLTKVCSGITDVDARFSCKLNSVGKCLLMSVNFSIEVAGSCQINSIEKWKVPVCQIY